MCSLSGGLNAYEMQIINILGSNFVNFSVCCAETNMKSEDLACTGVILLNLEFYGQRTIGLD